MISTTDTRNTEMSERLFLRSASSTFTQVITNGTNCSAFEATIISDKAQEIFRLGEYNKDKSLQPGQIVWQAISTNEPPGKPLSKCEFKTIYLTLHNIEEDREILLSHGHSAKRGQQINRITTEAYDQGTLLTQEDLATLLDCDVKTIRNDIHRYEKEHDIVLATRGNKKDIGPGITHREKAVELFLRGNDPLTIARQMKHSLNAVERYIQTFCRVIYCQREVKNTLKTAMIVGVSVALVNKYLALSTKLFNTKTYQQRLEEIMEVGSSYWHSQDLKKTVGHKKRRNR